MTFRRWLVAVALLTGVIAVSSALARSETQPFTVTAALDRESVLPQLIHGTAEPRKAPAGGVAEYGDHYNWLFTTFLQPGVRTFPVRALSLASSCRHTWKCPHRPEELK